MKSATSTRASRTKKPTEDEEKKTASKTTTTKTSGTKATLGRSKTDVGTKKSKTSKVANIASTDYEKLPSYMRPTASSRRNATSVGSQGKPEEAEKKPATRTTSKLTATKKKPKTGTKTGTTKKSKQTPKASDAEKSPDSNLEAPTPELSTEAGVDGAVAVGLRPATPPTPSTLQQDPVTHPSDNDSTGGLMETVDENPNDTCNVKQWTLFPEAMRESEDHRTTTAQMKSEEETSEALRGREHGEGHAVAAEDACEEEADSEETKKQADVALAEKLVTTETAVVVDSSDEEEDRQGSVDPAAHEGVPAASSSDPPTVDGTESRTEEAVEAASTDAAAIVPCDDQPDPAATEPITDVAVNNEDEAPLDAETAQPKAVEEKETSEDPQEPSVVQQGAGESSKEAQETNPKEPETEVEDLATDGKTNAEEVEAGADPKDETAEQSLQTTPVNKEQEVAPQKEEADVTPEPEVEQEADTTPVEEQQSRDPEPAAAADVPVKAEESTAAVSASAE